MSKYNDMKESYESRIKDLMGERDHYRRNYFSEAGRREYLEGQIKLYEKLLAKLLGESTNTDEIFMYEGKLYKPTNFTLFDNEGKPKQLNVDFVEYPVQVKKEKEDEQL